MVFKVFKNRTLRGIVGPEVGSNRRLEKVANIFQVVSSL
jgi:hypothetical protein